MLNKHETPWEIRLGYCGPTDCCLLLINPNGENKEYLIESVAWNILSCFWSIPEQKGTIPANLARVLWENCDNELSSSHPKGSPENSGDDSKFLSCAENWERPDERA